MSKKIKKKPNKNSNNCPEPFNSALNLAGGLAMAAIAGKMEEKYKYSENGKINPYAVSAFGVASGKMKSTEDIIRKGAFLGAAGVFDDAASDKNNCYIAGKNFASNRDANGVWRKYCESGEKYGLNPEDFANADDYEDALEKAKQNS